MGSVGSDEFDYIICGGGTSGCVVAARLAEDTNASILLIEAGADGKDNENIKMTGGWSKNFGNTETDWNLKTTPQKNADGRQVTLSRGKFLGGSSGVNGTLCIRGMKQDYDDWGLPGWSGDEFFEYMKKAETFHNKDWFQPEASAHGYNGPLHTEPHDMAPISKLLLKSLQSQGMPFEPDMFSTGSTPHGCGHAIRSVHKGIRSTGADFVTDDQHRDNITILCNNLVDKINFDSNKRAESVHLVDKSGQSRTVRARKEIIISGGAYCSPAILLRSGIGPKAELQQLGVDCVVDSPGVGKNLLDHLIVCVFYEVNQPGLTNDYLAYHGDAGMKSYLQYQENKTGLMASFPFGAFAYARLDDRLQNETLWQEAQKTTSSGRDPMGLTAKQPHIEFFTTELYGGPPQYDKYPIDKKSAFAILTELFSPRSKGSVTLHSKDPNENPVIDNAYLSDPLDVLVLSEGCRLGNEVVMQGAGTKDIVKGSWPEDLTHHKHTDREQWVPYVKQHATTCYHPAGTCKMGKDSDPMAVLDDKLNVRGVKGLRVADTSVMPTLNSGHTQMPAYGIGEKAADLIKAAAK